MDWKMRGTDNEHFFWPQGICPALHGSIWHVQLDGQAAGCSASGSYHTLHLSIPAWQHLACAAGQAAGCSTWAATTTCSTLGSYHM